MQNTFSTFFSFGMLLCGLVMLAMLTMTGCTSIPASIPASNRYQHGDFVRNLASAAPAVADEAQ